MTESLEIGSFAKLDMSRRARTGLGETVFAPGKSPEQLARIFAAFAERNAPCLATRATKEQAAHLAAAGVDAEFDQVSRTLVLRGAKYPRRKGRVAVATGGTADVPVAEEAAKTLEFFGVRADRFYDVGVAGLHRLLDKIVSIRRADVVIAVAGMEGALGSVIAGLVKAPVVAVPTSVGYGAGAGGIAPLLAMLNSCAEGLSVVNIDNGFGAAVCACRMLALKGKGAR